MPLIRYSCECGKFKSKFHRVGTSAPALLLCECGKDMKKTLSGPSSNSLIAIDNGVQARRVEVNIDSIKDNQNKARFITKLREKP